MGESGNNREERTTAQGLYHYALSYRDCAERLREFPPPELMFDAPIRFLYWHCAELLMKAFLRAEGLTLKELRGLGHSHAHLHAACVEHALPLGRYPEAFFDFADETEPMEARYIVTGARTLPKLSALSQVCSEIRQVVRPELRRRGLIVR